MQMLHMLSDKSDKFVEPPMYQSLFVNQQAFLFPIFQSGGDWLMTVERHCMKSCVAIGIVFAALAEPAYGLDEDAYRCPLEDLTPATYNTFRQKKDLSRPHRLMVIDCYAELLDSTSKNPDPQVTADIIALGMPRVTQLSEIYSEFIESLAVQNPQRLFDALLLVNKARVREVVTELRDPMVKDKKEIDASINLLHEDPRYAQIVALYLSEKAE
jgi:hypothetical protein